MVGSAYTAQLKPAWQGFREGISLGRSEVRQQASDMLHKDHKLQVLLLPATQHLGQHLETESFGAESTAAIPRHQEVGV